MARIFTLSEYEVDTLRDLLFEELADPEMSPHSPQQRLVMASILERLVGC